MTIDPSQNKKCRDETKKTKTKCMGRFGTTKTGNDDGDDARSDDHDHNQALTSGLMGLLTGPHLQSLG